MLHKHVRLEAIFEATSKTTAASSPISILSKWMKAAGIPTCGETLGSSVGGEAMPADATSKLVDQASAILSQIQSPLLYARVDGVERDGRLIVMELEINEPCLFLSFSNGAAARITDALMRVLQKLAFPKALVPQEENS